LTEGVKVQIGSQEFEVPPLSCWAAKQIALIARDASAKVTGEDGWIDVLFEQIRIALEPNYPDLDLAALQKAVPLRDMAEIHSAVMKASGSAKGAGSGEVVSP
jgi:hypothetical protein